MSLKTLFTFFNLTFFFIWEWAKISSLSTYHSDLGPMVKSNTNFYFNSSVSYIKRLYENLKGKDNFFEIPQANVKTKICVFKFWVDIKVRNRPGGEDLGRHKRTMNLCSDISWNFSWDTSIVIYLRYRFIFDIIFSHGSLFYAALGNFN